MRSITDEGVPEISENVPPSNVSMACSGIHDPTHLISADGYLTMFGRYTYVLTPLISHL